MHCKKGVNLSLDERIEIIADPTEAVREAAENWNEQLQQNKRAHGSDPRKWNPEPVRHADVLPDSPPDTFIEALGAAGCTFIAEAETVDGEPRKLLIEPHTTVHGIRVSLGYEELNL